MLDEREIRVRFLAFAIARHSALFRPVELTNAVALAAGERQKAVRVSLLDVLGQEVVGIEHLRVLAPDVGSTVQRVEIDEHCDSRRNLKLTCER